MYLGSMAFPQAQVHLSEVVYPVVEFEFGAQYQRGVCHPLSPHLAFANVRYCALLAHPQLLRISDPVVVGAN